MCLLKECEIGWQRVQDIVGLVAEDPEPVGSTQRGQQRSWVWMKSHPPVILASRAHSSQFFLLKTWDAEGTLEVISLDTVSYREGGCPQRRWVGCCFIQLTELGLEFNREIPHPCFFPWGTSPQIRWYPSAKPHFLPVWALPWVLSDFTQRKRGPRVHTGAAKEGVCQVLCHCFSLKTTPRGSNHCSILHKAQRS